MRATGNADIAAYAALVERDAAEYDRLISSLLIKVTEFLRDRDGCGTTCATRSSRDSSRRLGANDASCASGRPGARRARRRIRWR